MKRRNLTIPALLALMLAGSVPPTVAQTGNEDDADGPGRGVARLSLMNGEVSVRRGDSGDWVAGAINAPLMTEDRVFAGPRSRAEVQFDYYHRIRLAADTEVRLADIENGRYLLQLARGTATFSALKGGDAQVEISTPAAAVRPVAYGSYRITVGPDGTAEITVRSGEVEIYTPSGTERLKAGRTMLVRNGEGGGPEFQTVAAIGRDDWDRFNDERDKELRRGLETYRYVSRDIYGAEDLYGNGDWVYVAPYGNVWRPHVAVDWAPYRYGRWAWEDYYGWTWVSYDPWGWAPYHYGRWFDYGGRWCWYPGAVFGSRHYWSPGIVAWFGWGGGGIGIGVGGGWGRMGWVPLAPYDPFHRWWGRDHYRGYRNGDYHSRMTVVNNINITNVYRNARVRNSISVHDGDFSRGMRGQAFRGNSDELGRASVMRGGVPVSPGRESMRFAEREAGARPQGRNADSERFYSKTAARSVDRVPFERQREAIQAAERRSRPEARGGSEGIGTNRGENARSKGLETTTGRTSGVDTGRNARTGEDGRGGWRTLGEGSGDRGGGRDTKGVEGRTAMPRSGDSGGTTERGGWKTFGNPSGARTGGDTGTTRTNVRGSDEARGGEAAGTGGGSAWRGFGNPSRNSSGSRSAEATDGSRSSGSSRSTEATSSRSDSGRATWSTRGGDSGSDRGSTRTDTGRSDSGRGSSSRVESTGGSSSRGESRSVEPSRSAPASRSEGSSSRSEPSGRSSSPRTGGRSNNDDMAGARSSAPVSGFVSSGLTARWSTGGGSGEAASPRSFGSGSTGGFEARGESRSTSSGNRGNWSTGGSDMGSRSSASRSESFGSRSSGMSESRSMPSSRSMESRSYSGGGGMRAPSMGSRSSGGSFGGGGGMSSRSSGGSSFGGGGGMSSRSSGGSSSGGGRSNGGGGGRSSGGGGRR